MQHASRKDAEAAAEPNVGSHRHSNSQPGASAEAAKSDLALPDQPKTAHLLQSCRICHLFLQTQRGVNLHSIMASRAAVVTFLLLALVGAACCARQLGETGCRPLPSKFVCAYHFYVSQLAAGRFGCVSPTPFVPSSCQLMPGAHARRWAAACAAL